MAINVTKPAINLREKLNEVTLETGIKGEELLNSDTSTEARNVLELDTHLFTDFESTGIDDNATSTAITINSSEDVTFSNAIIRGTGGGAGLANNYSIANKQTAANAFGFVAEASGNDAWLKMGHNGTEAVIETAWQTTAGTTPLIFKTNGVERLRINESSGGLDISAGNVIVDNGYGIDFSAATPDGTGTVTSEVLDDYEEGTWSGNVVTGTATVANETYTKIGRSVTVTGNIYSFSDITTDIEIIVTGLPYVVNSSSLGAIGGRGIPLGKGYAAIGTNGQSQFKIMEQSNTTAYTFMKHSALIYASSSSTKMYFSFTYESN